MNKKDIELFEANILDGDPIDDCGDCKFSVTGVMDAIDFFQENTTDIIKEEIELLKEVSQYPSSAIVILEKVLARIEGTYHETKPLKFITKRDGIK